MSDYVPTTEEVRHAYHLHYGDVHPTLTYAAFDRWLDQVRSDAAAQALDDAAAAIRDPDVSPFGVGGEGDDAADWLHKRAHEIREDSWT